MGVSEHMSRNDQRLDRRARGQALPLVALLVWLVAGAGLLLVAVSQRAAERARTQAAADAAALAGAVDPAAAGLVAERNRASLGRLDAGPATGGRAYALTRFGAQVSAEAAAIAPPPGWAGLTPAMVAALQRAEMLLGEPVPVVSGFRSRAQQQALWDLRHTNPYPVARPGTSAHERGVAVDVALSFVPRLRPVIGRVGLCQPLPATDPVHFVMCG